MTYRGTPWKTYSIVDNKNSNMCTTTNTNYKFENNVLPKIVDIEWKLEISTNTSNIVTDNLIYTVVLKTDSGNDICFTCGTQQLQDLVYKLKDLVRHCERVKGEFS